MNTLLCLQLTPASSHKSAWNPLLYWNDYFMHTFVFVHILFSLLQTLINSITSHVISYVVLCHKEQIPKYETWALSYAWNENCGQSLGVCSVRIVDTFKCVLRIKLSSTWNISRNGIVQFSYNFGSRKISLPRLENWHVDPKYWIETTIFNRQLFTVCVVHTIFHGPCGWRLYRIHADF